jgi:hypothetical protein
VISAIVTNFAKSVDESFMDMPVEYHRANKGMEGDFEDPRPRAFKLAYFLL